MKWRPLACAGLLAACSNEQSEDPFTANVADVETVPVSEADAAKTAPTPAPPRDFTGRWVGVEGMVLDVARGDAPGRYRLDMRYDLDHRQSVEGRAEGGGIAFERGGVTMRLRPTDGAATGLKHLAGKRDCLTVASGEGYCRA